MVGIVSPRVQKSVFVLVHDERRKVIVSPAVLEAILVMGKDVDEIVPSVIPPRRLPLAFTGSVVGCVLSPSAIAAFEITRRVYYKAGGAKTVAYGL